MKRYKLTKDLPTFRAGQLAYVSSLGNLMAGTPENQETTDTGLILMIYHETTLKKFPEILTEWFEEIQEPTDSIHWKPVMGEEYWLVYPDGDIGHGVCTGGYWDDTRYKMGSVYRTEKEAEKARDRRLAEVILRRTSTFKPDFKNGKGGWIVGYDYQEDEILPMFIDFMDYGEVVHYKTRKEAEESIEENRKDWLIYFGIKEGE